VRCGVSRCKKKTREGEKGKATVAAGMASWISVGAGMGHCNAGKENGGGGSGPNPDQRVAEADVPHGRHSDSGIEGALTCGVRAIVSGGGGG
jgi:hypothetical protein